MRAQKRIDNLKKAMGRPPKPIDWELVDKLLIAGCMATEVAAHFHVHADTFCTQLEKKYGMTFTSYSAEKRQKGDSLLRSVQFNKALKGDNSLLIWLGKNRLKQRENEDKTDVPPNDKALGELLIELKKNLQEKSTANAKNNPQ